MPVVEGGKFVADRPLSRLAGLRSGAQREVMVHKPESLMFTQPVPVNSLLDLIPLGGSILA